MKMTTSQLVTIEHPITDILKGAGRKLATPNWKIWRELFLTSVRENRFELFGTFGPYKVITNGYGELTCFEVDNGRFTIAEITAKFRDTLSK